MDELLLTPEAIAQVLGLENINDFIKEKVFAVCRAQHEKTLSKLLTAAPDVREKVNELLLNSHDGMCVKGGYVYDGDACPLEDDEGAFDCEKCYTEAIHALYAGAILAAADKADAKWVTALKPFNITVDSPESLAESVQLLLEDARRKERSLIRAEVEKVKGENPYHEKEYLVQSRMFFVYDEACNRILEALEG